MQYLEIALNVPINQTFTYSDLPDGTEKILLNEKSIQNELIPTKRNIPENTISAIPTIEPATFTPLLFLEVSITNFSFSCVFFLSDYCISINPCLGNNGIVISVLCLLIYGLS